MAMGPALWMLAAVTAAQVPLNVILKVRLGDTRAAVEAAWKDLGPLTATNEKNGAVTLEAGPDKVTLCRGKVVLVTHELGDDFNAFASVAEVITHVYGQPGSPDFLTANSGPPAADPRGEAMKMSGIRLRWKAAPNYMLGYSEVNGHRQAVESLIGQNSCAVARPTR